jgi:hypothetical protein
VGGGWQVLGRGSSTARDRQDWQIGLFLGQNLRQSRSVDFSRQTNVSYQKACWLAFREQLVSADHIGRFANAIAFILENGRNLSPYARLVLNEDDAVV